MTVSHVTDFESTGASIVANAFKHIRVSQKGQSIQSDDAAHALSMLNNIVTSWIRDGLRLWKNKEAAVFLEPSRRIYTLGNLAAIGCSDECNADDVDTQMVYATSGDWVLTSLTSAASAGADKINIASLRSYAGLTYNTDCEMNIGIVNVNNGIDWYSIADVDQDTFDVLIVDVLVNDATEGATVYIYRANDQLTKPLKIYQDNVRLMQVQSSYELPMPLMAWTDYNLLPQKDTQGVPVQAFYEPGIDNTEVAVWPVSDTVENILLFRFQSLPNIFSVDTDTQDFPSEWIRPLEWTLASELGYSYGLPIPRQQMLDARASSLKDAVEDWDQDNTPMFIYPNQWGRM